MGVSRIVGRRATLAAAGLLPLLPSWAYADDARESALIRQVAGGDAVPSPRVRLDMPAVFGNGYSVPLKLAVDSEMTDADHVRIVHVIAPLNPIVLVARFAFTPSCGRAALSTRIRLAKPQDVIAIAEMGDGTRLLGRRFVTVQTDGCS